MRKELTVIQKSTFKIKKKEKNELKHVHAMREQLIFIDNYMNK